MIPYKYHLSSKLISSLTCLKKLRKLYTIYRMKKIRIILASRSKARSRILRQCGIPHTVMASNAKEIMNQKKNPRYNVRINAHRKAQAIAKTLQRGFVIGADTLVLLGKRLIGKPKSKQEARALLEAFSGKNNFTLHGSLPQGCRKQQISRSNHRHHDKGKTNSQKQIQYVS